MSLKQKITDDMKAAMRAGDTKQRDTIRLLQAAIKQKEVDERIELDDAAVVAVIEKMLKQRRDSITQYEAAQRHDLATAEREEVNILSTYMPKAFTDEEVGMLIADAILLTGAKGMQDMGKVMAEANQRLAGKADGKTIASIVKNQLT